MSTPRMNELVPCPFCSPSGSVLVQCSLCHGNGEVPRYMAMKCIHMCCEKSPFGRGPLCRKHGCVVCGEVMLADYEEEQLCDECGTLNHRCTWCGKPAMSVGADGTYTCGQGQGDGLEAHDNKNVVYTPLWHLYVNDA